MVRERLGGWAGVSTWQRACVKRNRSRKGVGRMRRTRTRRVGLPVSRAGRMAAVVAVVAMSSAVGLLAPGVGQASSHREAPLIAGDPQADSTELVTIPV